MPRRSRFRAIFRAFCAARRHPACAFRRPRRRRHGSAPAGRRGQSPLPTLAKPPTTWPALPAIASASSALRSSSRSVVAVRSAATRTFRLKAAGKHVALDRLARRGAGGGDPDAAAGQLALDVGHGVAVGADDEADHLVDRLERAGERAMPLHPRSDTGRSGVELDIVRVVSMPVSCSLAYRA